LEIVQINYHVVLDATSNELWKEVDVLIVGAKGRKTERLAVDGQCSAGLTSGGCAPRHGQWSQRFVI
jgi:hypothetical protein